METTFPPTPDSKTVPVLGKNPPRPSPEASSPPQAELPPREETPVRAEAPAAVAETTPVTGAALCPKCKGKLIDPEGLGWCLVCGYCRSTTDETARLIVPEKAPTVKKPSPLGVVECFQLLIQVPLWVIINVAVGVGIVFLAMAIDSKLPPDSRPRALWSTIQIGGSLIVLFLAQLWSLILLAPRDDRLGMWDAVIPFKLWNISLKALPVTRGPVSLGAWSLTSLATAIIVIGGLSYWLPKKPGEKKAHAAPAVVRVILG